MAKTATDLYRSLMGDTAKAFQLKNGVYPGDGILNPRWVTKERIKPNGSRFVDQADVSFNVGSEGIPLVLPGGGTSLHDVPGWFASKEFWIPKGTEYSEEINIVAEAKLKTSRQTNVQGRHYQLEVRKPMTQQMFEGYLNNMARAAVALQVNLAHSGQ